MDDFEGWVPDPFEAHEVRYFVDGVPTKLIRDGSVEGFDDLPPRSEWPSHLQPARPTPPAQPVQASELAQPVQAPGSVQPTVEVTTQPPPPPPAGYSYWTRPPGDDTALPPLGPSSDPSGAAPAFDTFVGGSDVPPTRRSRRRLVGALVALVVLASAGSVIAVVSGGKSAEAAVIDSVNSSMADKTASLSMHMTINSSGSTVTGTGTGGIDFSQNALQLDMNVLDQGQQVPIKALYIGGSIYESIQGLDQIVPGKSWISIDISSLTTGGQGSGALGTGNNPTAMLRLLALQGNKVTPLGSSTVDGVPVQGYSVKLNPATVKQQLADANLPAWMGSVVSEINIQSASNTVYVDGSGLLRRYSVKLTESAPSTGTVSLDESLDFSDYGTPVSVSAPPSNEVVSFTQFLQDAAAAEANSSP
jgi:hypothetical protein